MLPSSLGVFMVVVVVDLGLMLLSLQNIESFSIRKAAPWSRRVEDHSRIAGRSSIFFLALSYLINDALPPWCTLFLLSYPTLNKALALK